MKWKVSHHRDPRCSGRFRKIERRRVCRDHPKPLVVPLLQQPDQIAISLHGRDLRPGVQQCRSEMAQTSAQLNHGLTCYRTDRLDDPLQGGLVSKKVLSPTVLGPQLVLPEDFGGRRKPFHYRRQAAFAFSASPARTPRRYAW